MAKKPFPLPEVYGLLEPGPVILLSTAAQGKTNVMALSWHMMVEFEPPLVACVVSNRDDSYEMLLESGACVINIPTLELADQVVGCGNTHGSKVDKFARFGLTKSAASQVEAPLIEECYANLECKIYDRDMVEKYGIFILEVVAAWIDPERHDPRTLHHRGYGAFMTAGETVKLASKMK